MTRAELRREGPSGNSDALGFNSKPLGTGMGCGVGAGLPLELAGLPWVPLPWESSDRGQETLTHCGSDAHCTCRDSEPAPAGGLQP